MSTMMVRPLVLVEKSIFKKVRGSKWGRVGKSAKNGSKKRINSKMALNKIIENWACLGVKLQQRVHSGTIFSRQRKYKAGLSFLDRGSTLHDHFYGCITVPQKIPFRPVKTIYSGGIGKLCNPASGTRLACR